jgi:ribosome modulation factor
MTQEQEEIYQEGYRAQQMGQPEESNPYTGLNAEFWSDGWDDSAEDQSQ